MYQGTEMFQTQTVDEINVNKMQFRVISKRPQYSSEEILKIKRNIGSELYQIFKKYQEN